MRLLAAFFVILLVSWPGAAVAQSGALAEAYRQGMAHYQAGRYGKAILFFEKALKLGEREFGPDHQTTSLLLNNLAELYRAQGRYADAEPLHKRSLAIREKALGPDHPDVAASLNNLALLYRAQGRYADAEPLHKRSLAIREKALGPDHPDVAAGLISLAELYRAQGRYVDAEPLYKRSLVIGEKTLGPDHPSVATGLNNLALLYEAQGRYADAEPLYKRSLAIFEKALGPEHPDVATNLNGLAALYYRQGRYGEAESLYKRSQVIIEKALGPDHPSVATGLNNLALLYEAQGRYGDAEPLHKHSLAIREKALGPEHPHVADSLNNLAGLYENQGRYAEAEPLYKRSLAIREKALGPDHPDVAASLNNLAGLYENQGRYAEAEPLYKRSLAIKEKALRPGHPDVALSLNNLAFLYENQGRNADAEPLYKRSQVIIEKALGPDHPSVATGLNNLAELYRAQGRYADAEPLHKRALAIKEKALSPDHPSVATSLNNLALLYEAQGRHADALVYIRRASVIHRERAARSAGGRSGGSLSEQKTVRVVFIHHVEGAWSVAGSEPSRRVALTAEGFEAGQLALATGTAAALAGMGARFATGDDALSSIIRARQDAAEQWRRLDKKLVEFVSLPPDKRDKGAEQKLRAQLSALDRELKDLDGRLFREFPEYAELASPRPLPLAEVQKLLGPNEALLSYVVAKDNTFLWAARKDDARMFRLDIGQEALAEAVMDLRTGLDPTGITDPSDIPAFDTTEAHRLYNRIFAAAEPLLDGVRHLFVVPDGPLQSLPLGVLVTKETKADFTDFSGYRQVPWLARKYAMTTLPSVSSLRALRRFAQAARANRPFGGIGDPLLEGHPGESRGVELASLFTSRGIADVDAVRSQLAPLPETAGELEAMARILGGGKADLFLRERATEGRIKTEALNKYRVLAFATHGLVAGDLEGLAEPALVLTPPSVGTDQDDGLLTASEVATLKLNADMVVLSACNTASADGTPDAEALSGLAKAFFYAGSRSLLVSHWLVGSDAAVNLTTTMLKEMANDDSVGRAEGLRRSMLALMETPDKPHYAHPMFWAPFVVVGEGGKPMNAGNTVKAGN